MTFVVQIMSLDGFGCCFFAVVRFSSDSFTTLKLVCDIMLLYIETVQVEVKIIASEFILSLYTIYDVLEIKMTAFGRIILITYMYENC